MNRFDGWEISEIIEYIDDFILECEHTKESMKTDRYHEDIDLVITVYTKMKEMLLETCDLLNTVIE